VEAVPQDHSLATYAPKLDRETAHLDWSLPAVEVARWIRGLDEVPGAWNTIDGGNTVKLFCPTVEPRGGAPGEVLELDADRGILVAAADEAVRIADVQPAGRRRMSAGEWIRGRGIAAGARLT
jgi:methionyl-tRNA formyltransferase